jgi:hypothetical protein
VVDAVWAKVSQSAAAGDYLSCQAPGDALRVESEVAEVDAKAASGEQSGPRAAHHLAIITVQIQSIDWLELARSGHRRALLKGDEWAWLVP